VSGAGVQSFTVHARKAWLQGLSPKENREIPPLNYDRVHRLKAEFPALHISINGGIENLDQAMPHLADLDGVMLGRAAYHNPWILSGVDQVFGHGAGPVTSRREVVERYMPYVEAELARGTPLHRITRHMLGLYHAQPGGRIWRQILTVEGAKAGADASVIWRGLAAVEAQAARLREAALRSEQVVDGVNHALTARINAIVEA
jgi:tRNA-dihydrouridine synthase A